MSLRTKRKPTSQLTPPNRLIVWHLLIPNSFSPFPLFFLPLIFKAYCLKIYNFSISLSRDFAIFNIFIIIIKYNTLNIYFFMEVCMNIKISTFIKSLLLSYIITLLILFLLSFLLLKFRLNESIISFGITLSYVLSCFSGGYLSGRKVSSRRFLWGLITGILYFLFLTLISLLINKGLNSDVPHFFTVLIMCAFSGMLGGMVTVHSQA